MVPVDRISTTPEVSELPSNAEEILAAKQLKVYRILARKMGLPNAETITVEEVSAAIKAEGEEVQKALEEARALGAEIQVELERIIVGKDRGGGPRARERLLDETFRLEGIDSATLSRCAVYHALMGSSPPSNRTLQIDSLNL